MVQSGMMAGVYVVVPFFLALMLPSSSIGQEIASWSDVWSYVGLQGPEYWGGMYTAWRLCKKGQKQSPIDLRAETLVYDPNLSQLEITSPLETTGFVNNTGRGLSFFPEGGNATFISGGPLSYRYRLTEIRVHFGQDELTGSEHTVGGRPFPGELQMIFYNTDLYNSYTEAETSPNGLAIIALFMKQGNTTGRELGRLTGIKMLARLVYKGSRVNVTGLSIPLLLPETREYMTYEGSTTTPMCTETVTWIIFNRPVYVTHYQFETFRELRLTRRGEGTKRISENYRDPQPLGTRTVRTNIIQKYNAGGKECPLHRREYSYKTLISRR